MTTGLITFFRHHHYGAQLQAYAAMRAMTELGHPCEIIDYRPDYDAGLNDLFRRGGVRAQLSNAHTALHYQDLKRRAERFDAFVADEMVLTPTRYTSYEQLCQNPPERDVYVAGSDQIWNPAIYPGGTFDPAYLLSFVKEGRRISYAPSMGSRPFTRSEADRLRTALEPFSALSAREGAGRDAVRAATGRTPTLVVDPTLLLTAEQWAGLAAPPQVEGPYLLCYYISDHAVLDPLAQAIAKRTGWPVIQLGQRRRLPYASKVVLDAGPREFLSLFRHAAFVCTNSFHGTVFSLHFGKDFYTSVSPREMAHPEESRVWSLLSRLDCTSRVAGTEGTDGLDTPVDYDRVHARMDGQRTRCLDWLSCAIEGRDWTEPADAAGQGPARPLLASRASCTGCTACAQVCPVGAITMQPDGEGFLRPVVGDACVLCRKCETACPAVRPPERGRKPSQAWAVWNLDGETRAASSSGGFFSVLAGRIIDQGGAVFGAVFDNDFRGVHHACARTRDELVPMRGSKYVQSDLRDTFRQAKELLDRGTTVLYTGLPCQIAGLKGFLGRDYDNLVTCDMVCNSVSSPAVYAAFIDQLETGFEGKLTSVDFKAGDWDAPRFAVTLTPGPKKDEKSLTKLLSRPPVEEWSEALYTVTYGRGFGMAMYQRPCCSACPYTGVEVRPGDFTMADFWGLGTEGELPPDRERGVSLVLAHTDKARALLDALGDGVGRVPRPLDEALSGNPRLSGPMTHSPRRAAFFRLFREKGWPAAAEKFLGQPGLVYRTAARVLSPEMKARIRRLLG